MALGTAQTIQSMNNAWEKLLVNFAIILTQNMEEDLGAWFVFFFFFLFKAIEHKG